MKFDFFKIINKIRNITGKYKVPVIVILDGYSEHFNEEVKEFLTSKNIIFKFIVLHSNHITYSVDWYIVLFVFNELINVRIQLSFL